MADIHELYRFLPLHPGTLYFKLPLQTCIMRRRGVLQRALYSASVMGLPQLPIPARIEQLGIHETPRSPFGESTGVKIEQDDPGYQDAASADVDEPQAITIISNFNRASPASTLVSRRELLRHERRRGRRL